MLGLVAIFVTIIIAYIILMEWLDFGEYKRKDKQRQVRRIVQERKQKIAKRVWVLRRAGMYETADVIFEGFYEK